jgi:hypothetical protein
MVWDVFIFRYLLHWYLVVDDSGYKRDEGTCGFSRVCALQWKHKIYDRAVSTRASVVSLLKVVDRSLTSRIKTLRSTYG